MKTKGDTMVATMLVGVVTAILALLGLLINIPWLFTLGIAIFALNATLRSVISLVEAISNNEVDGITVIDIAIIVVGGFLTIKYLVEFAQIAQLSTV